MSILSRWSLLVSLLLSTLAWAGEGEIRFVETTVDLNSDGSALVLYQLQWWVKSGEMHGFYFEGNDRLKVGMAVDQAAALDGDGKRYRLDIRPMGGGKWDVLLADGAGVAAGRTLSYSLPFKTNFHQAGYLLPTTADDGRELVAFNWSPVQWDQAATQDHYTLKIITPFVLPADADPRALVDSEQLVLTEPWVNEQYRIDYQRGPKGRLLLLFHKTHPGNRFQMRVQFYMPAVWFSLTGPKSGTVATEGLSLADGIAAGPERPSIGLLGFGLFGLGAFYLLVRGKQRSVLRARSGLDQIRWENIDWTPPKLVLSEFRRPGKVCRNLSPLEAAFYLEIPFKTIVSAMLASLVREGFVEIASERPLRVQVRQQPDLIRMDAYERLLFASLEDDGELSQAELEALMNKAVRAIQTKAWDADIEATQTYYRQQVEAFVGAGDGDGGQPDD